MEQTLEQRKLALYTAVGIALSRWSHVEWSLCNLFSACLNPGDFTGHSSKAYWAVVSFEAKLKMCDAVIRSRCSHEESWTSQWNKIHNRLIVNNKARNKIAHGTVMGWKYGPDGNRKEDAALAPYFYTFRSTIDKLVATERSLADFRPDDRLYVSDIMQSAIAFHATDQRICCLSDEFFRKEILPKLIKSGAAVTL